MSSHLFLGWPLLRFPYVDLQFNNLLSALGLSILINPILLLLINEVTALIPDFLLTAALLTFTVQY